MPKNDCIMWNVVFIKKKESEGQEDQQTKIRVVKVDSLESWDHFVNRATNQGCPVSFFNLKIFILLSIKLSFLLSGS